MKNPLKTSRFLRRVAIVVALPIALVHSTISQTFRCLQLHNLWNYVGAGWSANLRAAGRAWNF